MAAAIRVQNLGKCYRVAHHEQRGNYHTLRESIVNAIKAPFRRLRNPGKSSTVEDFWALKDISFDVQPGEVVGIIGRNGAGKSTLLKILSRITKPTKGRVELNGRVGSLLEVGTGFHPELSGRENIYLNGSILGMSRKEIDRKFDEIVAFAEIEKFLDTAVKRYSSGMYVRLAFAVAAHLEPEIMIVDEVLAVGDAEFQKRCLDKMNEVGKSGRTILFVSHNMGAVEHLCSSAILIDGGKISAVGPVREIISMYQMRGRVSEESIVDLANHPNRRGASPPKLRKLTISSNGLPTRAIQCGSGLELTIEYDCNRKPVDLKLGITIEDHRGVRVVNFTTSWQAPDLLRNTPIQASVQCSIPKITMVPGNYPINIYYDDGMGSESVENACELEVLPGDVFGTGRVPESKYGIVYMDSSWVFVN
jgi:lipopolysaccharide transport system ATP-binding protein